MNKFPFEKARVACLDLHSPLYLRTKNDKYGGGDIGDLYDLVDRATEAGFRIIQFNPIHDTINASPYFGVSGFSYNPIFLSVQRLGLDVIPPKMTKNNKNIVGYRSLYNFKIKILEKLFIKNKAYDKIKFADFDRQVLAYALFKTLKEKFKSQWFHWPNKYKKADIDQILDDHSELHHKVKFYLFAQSIIKQQWRDLALYAQKKGLLFVFDKPIYPIHDSADVWANQKLFYLNPEGTLKYESGCNNPRDPFGPQRWGHAVYRFKEKKEMVIDYFVRSIQEMQPMAKIIRLDHTLALIWKYYLIDPKTGHGFHLPALKHKLFKKLMASFPDVFFIAEDVGYVSKKNVDLPLSKHQIPGIRCPQWVTVPKYTKFNKYPLLSVAMTANHDTASLPAWWQKLNKSRKHIFYRQLPSIFNEQEASILEIVRLIFNTQSIIASITLRDLTNDLRRYNTPGKKNYHNWKLRSPLTLEEIDFDQIAEIIKESGR